MRHRDARVALSQPCAAHTFIERLRWTNASVKALLGGKPVGVCFRYERCYALVAWYRQVHQTILHLDFVPLLFQAHWC
jgi:hypothetical protein